MLLGIYKCRDRLRKIFELWVKFLYGIVDFWEFEYKMMESN